MNMNTCIATVKVTNGVEKEMLCTLLYSFSDTKTLAQQCFMH